MQQPQTIDILNVTLLEIQPQRVFLGQEVDGVECLGLGFGDRWDVGAAFLGTVPREVASGVLEDDLALSVDGDVVEEGSGGVAWVTTKAIENKSTYTLK
jgi:hypothetical protein